MFLNHEDDEGEMVPIADVIEMAMQMLKRGIVRPEKRETYAKTLISFRTYYNSIEKEIIELAKQNHFVWYDSYPMDLMEIFTPIETNVWQIIRYTGRVVLYPQFPVGPYFADFGNPYLKIALEVDGKEFHQDVEKDSRRDLEMKGNGWKVFRVSGYESYNYVERNEEMEADGDYELFDDWLFNTAEGVVWAIRMMFFEQLDMTRYHLADKIIYTLEKHSYHYRY